MISPKNINLKKDFAAGVRVYRLEIVYSQSCWYFLPSFVNCCCLSPFYLLSESSPPPPPPLPYVNKYSVY